MALSPQKRASLLKLDADYESRPEPVRLLLAAPLELGFKVEETGAGLKLIVQGAHGRAGERKKLMNAVEALRKTSRLSRADLDAVPWGLFEATDEERAQLRKRIGMMLVSDDEVYDDASSEGKKRAWADHSAHDALDEAARKPQTRRKFEKDKGGLY